MLFYELTWSPISQPAKEAIAFDSTAAFAHRRASVNNLFKHFINDVAPDPLVYTGTGRASVSDGGARRCAGRSALQGSRTSSSHP